MLATTTVFAHEDGDRVEVKSQAQFKANLEHGKKLGVFKHMDMDLRDDDHFAIAGTVSAVGSTSLSVNVRDDSVKVVVVDADTKFSINGKTEIRLADIKVGDKVMIKGEIEDNGGLEADRVVVMVRPQRAFGEVTAKTDNSITIKNNVTGDVKTLTVNPDTKVMVNGEAKTAADIQVGDRGMVKFKAMLDSFVATVIKLFR